MKKAPQPCTDFVGLRDRHNLPSWNTECQSCGWHSSKHPKLSAEAVKDWLVFYSQFPPPEHVYKIVKKREPKQTNITEKTICSTLRHNFTNYERLSHSQLWEHDVLREEVNRLILLRIGDTWKEHKEAEWIR